MLTYNKIIELNKEFADAHDIIKNFGNGADFDTVLHDQEAPYRYPIMWMEDLPSPIETGLESFSFRVVFLQQVEQLRNRDNDFILVNNNEVKSDMKQCGIDFLSYWKQDHNYKDQIRFDITTTWNYLEDVTADRLSGGYLEVSFKVKQTFNKCIIPMQGVTPPTSSDVIFQINSVNEDTIPCGSTFDLTVEDTLGNNPVVSYDEDTNTLVTQAGGAASIDIDINGTSFLVGQTTNVDIPVVDTDENPVGSNNGGLWEIAGTAVTANGDAMATLLAEQNLALNIHDSAGGDIGTISNPDTITVGDATQTMNGSAIASQLPETAKAFTIEYANGDPVVVTTVTNTATVFEGTVPNPTPSVSRSMPYKSGAVTSVIANDDASSQIGRGTSWTNLGYNNFFGNTDRFTDTLGTQVYANNIVIDWAYWDDVTGACMWWYNSPFSSTGTNALANQPYTLDIYNDWRVPNVHQLTTLFNSEFIATGTGLMNYPPFNLGSLATANRLWTCNPLNVTTMVNFNGSLTWVNNSVGTTCRVLAYRIGNTSEL